MPPEPAPGPQSSPPPSQSPSETPPPPPSPSEVAQLPPPGYRLVWQDDFDRAALDASRWRVMTGPRRDAENTPDAVTLQNGVLRITTSTEKGVHETGFLTTDGLFDATYGYFEARIRFSDAPGEWCAFWLQSPTNGQPKGDPARAGVEIDVVEHRVTDQGGWQLADYVALNLNWDGYDADRQNAQRVTQLPDRRPIQGQWRTFGVLWTETGYVFYVDGVPLWSIDEAVSRRPETLQLTCEVSDGSWAGYVPRGGYGPRASSTAGMEVDWVRVWQKAP
jgi:beta-glucanase (GH16 family)